MFRFECLDLKFSFHGYVKSNWSSFSEEAKYNFKERLSELNFSLFVAWT